MVIAMMSALPRSVTIVLGCGAYDCGISGPFGPGLIDPAWVLLTCAVEAPGGTCDSMNMALGVTYSYSGAKYPTILGGADGIGEIRCQLGDVITFSLQQVMEYHPFFLTSEFFPIPFFVNVRPEYILNSSQITFTGTQGAIGTPTTPAIFTVTCDAKFQAIPTVYFICEHHYPMAVRIILADPVAGGPFTKPPSLAPTTVAPSPGPTKAPTVAPTNFAAPLSASITSVLMVALAFFFAL